MICLKSISSFFFHRNEDPAAAKPEPLGTVAAEEAADSPAGPADIVQLPLERIEPNPFQPRKTFHDAGLHELAASIQEFGIIQPLVIRATERGYELIAGERRLRASRQAGLTTVPCVIRPASDKEMAELALIENLQREDLHFFEESAGYEKLLTLFELTQEELARRVGKNQSTIANKLRLLKLAPEIREFICQEGLTERHARALLKVEDLDLQGEILRHIAESKLNVKDAEAYIESRLTPPNETVKPVKRKPMLKMVRDVRIFINTVGELAKQMKKVGLDVKVSQVQDEETVTITMVVPKRK